MSRATPPAPVPSEQWPTSAQPPLPVAPLGYSEFHDPGPWARVVRVFFLAAVATGLAQLVISLGQLLPALQMLWTGGGFRGTFDRGSWLYLLVELAGDAAAVTLVLLGTNVFGRREWVPRAFVAAAAVMAGSFVATALVRTGQLLLMPAGPFRGSQLWYYLLSTMGGTVRQMVLPALFIWLMTRPAVRRQFSDARLS